MADKPVLTLACAFSDRIEALLDGRVAVEGFDLAVQIRQPQAIFGAVLRDQAYDIAEMSLGSHLAATADGGGYGYVGLPVFLSRAFRHSNIYVRADRISRPEDLAGRRIGVIDYQQTAGVWVRGFLADDHGVARDGVDWVTGGLDVPVAEGRAPPPPGVSIRRTTGSLNQMLSDGDLEAIISPIAPRAFRDGDQNIARLFPDPRAVELDHYRRTGLFPLMHCVVLRRALVEAHPGLPAALYKAFEAARRLAAADLDGRDYPKIASPWLSSARHEVFQMLGRDPWTYGVEANRAELAALARYTFEDGLSDRPLSAAELFASVN
jgi:4,5-dihydroxyphthalate decarboxylase